jgi:hypothetical protein
VQFNAMQCGLMRCNAMIHASSADAQSATQSASVREAGRRPFHMARRSCDWRSDFTSVHVLVLGKPRAAATARQKPPASNVKGCHRGGPPRRASLGTRDDISGEQRRGLRPPEQLRGGARGRRDERAPGVAHGLAGAHRDAAPARGAHSPGDTCLPVPPAWGASCCSWPSQCWRLSQVNRCWLLMQPAAARATGGRAPPRDQSAGRAAARRSPRPRQHPPPTTHRPTLGAFPPRDIHKAPGPV